MDLSSSTARTNRPAEPSDSDVLLNKADLHAAASDRDRDANMADPFEVRMRFTAQLQHLNASVTSAQKAAQYALKYRDMDEDLHSCILEQLDRVRSLSYLASRRLEVHLG